VLKAQVERARSLGYEPMIGSELEFYLLKESFEEAHGKHYRDLTPSVPYILDYHVLATTTTSRCCARSGMGCTARASRSRARRARRGRGTGVNFRFADAVTMADNHTVYKNGAKEIAHLNGCSITFMAKPDHSWIGSSCHIHASLWRDGANAFDGGPDVFKQFLAGWIAGAKEMAIFLAPRSTRTSATRRAPGRRQRSLGT